MAVSWVCHQSCPFNAGVIKVVDKNNKENLIEISGGSLEMSNNKITILAQGV